MSQATTLQATTLQATTQANQTQVRTQDLVPAELLRQRILNNINKVNNFRKKALCALCVSMLGYVITYVLKVSVCGNKQTWAEYFDSTCDVLLTSLFGLNFVMQVIIAVSYKLYERKYNKYNDQMKQEIDNILVNKLQLYDVSNEVYEISLYSEPPEKNEIV